MINFIRSVCKRKVKCFWTVMIGHHFYTPSEDSVKKCNLLGKKNNHKSDLKPKDVLLLLTVSSSQFLLNTASHIYLQDIQLKHELGCTGLRIILITE